MLPGLNNEQSDVRCGHAFAQNKLDNTKCSVKTILDVKKHFLIAV